MQWSGEQGEEKIGSQRELASRIARLDPDSDPFGVLTRGGSDFIQTAAQGRGFVIEKRERGSKSNLVARRAGSRPAPSAPRPEKAGFLARLFGSSPPAPPRHDAFTREEVKAAFLAWYEGTPDPDFLVWEEDAA